MTDTLKTFGLAFALASTMMLTAAHAGAECRKKPEISLSDGSKGCVLAVEVTEFTTTYSWQGDPGINRFLPSPESNEGGLVAIKITSEKDASSLRNSTIRRRAREVCKSYRGNFPELAKSQNKPFMAVLFIWGEIPKEGLNQADSHLRKAYFTKSCWELKQS